MDQISLYSDGIYLVPHLLGKLLLFHTSSFYFMAGGIQRNHFWIFTIFLSIAKKLMSREKTFTKKCETSTDSLKFKCHEIILLFQKTDGDQKHFLIYGVFFCMCILSGYQFFNTLPSQLLLLFLLSSMLFEGGASFQNNA